MMESSFSKNPILNSPYAKPSQHWQLDAQGRPSQIILETRRKVDFITPIPKPKKRKDEPKPKQESLVLDLVPEISTQDQDYHKTLINDIRNHIDKWRSDPVERWKVTPETARLLQHWRSYNFGGIRPFFCQIEAVETAIWLTEVAPQLPAMQKYVEHLKASSEQHNPDLARLALKLATGAGKTTVMAMMVAWQTLNAVRHPRNEKFTKGFLIVTPGITIKDRLRVLQPNDPDEYYRSRELVPVDMLREMQQARIVITNYHAFKLREKLEVSKGTRALLEGWRGKTLPTTESDGEMLHRVMPNLMGLKRVMVFNDEAHHCYRARPDAETEIADLKGDDKAEAKENNDAARLWISGLETVQRRIGISRVFDLSATPFFLRGSGYAEGTLFPWTMSDFSLMDAIECGIVKLPRVPVAENITGQDMPMFRNLWENIRSEMPKKGRGNAGTLDPLSLPPKLITALEALYGNYQKTFDLWQQEGIKVPPCFIIVCNNTATSKLIYDYVSGFTRETDQTFENGRLELFRNFNDDGSPKPRPSTLLIDSQQLESGDKLDDTFRTAAADEIERFRRTRHSDLGTGKDIDDATLLREVMNTVGKDGQLGSNIRCVVSVSMLTEGWDANTVTHILGVRAFGTQLLCEQVIGRALRRQSYDLNEEGRFNVEYADVFGIPFDFNAEAVVVRPVKPRLTIQVKAIRPERDSLEIRFPRVDGYRTVLPVERLDVLFNDDHIVDLTPELVGPTTTRNEGIIGEGVDLDLSHINDMRFNTILMELTKHLLMTKWRDPNESPKLHLFGQLKLITKQWLETCLKCSGGTYPAQILYQSLANMACERIAAAVIQSSLHDKEKDQNKLIQAIMNPYNPEGSTRHVNFTTSKTLRWETNAKKSHLNWMILDSEWEGEFCRIAESHERVLAYVKNHNLGFEVPYLFGGVHRSYIPDFIVLVDDGHGTEDPLHLIVEVKGYRGEDAKEKKSTMETQWLPAVNTLGQFGRWAFVEFTDVFEMESKFSALIKGIIKEEGRTDV